MKLDSTISTYRKKINMTQQKLAELLEVPRTTASFYENKKMYPDLKTAERIANILGVTIGQLYNQKELDVILIK